jgi:hypothetical protein
VFQDGILTVVVSLSGELCFWSTRIILLICYIMDIKERSTKH